MKSKPYWTLGIGLGLIALTAIGLHQVQGSHQLGEPGLKLAERPLESDSGVVVTNLVVALPFSVGEMVSTPLPVSQVELDWLPKDTLYGRRIYKSPDGFESMISVVLMGKDRTSIHKPQYCLPGQGWVIEKTEEMPLTLKADEETGTLEQEIRAMKLSMKRSVKVESGQEVEILGYFIYWFVSGDQQTPDHRERMYMMAKDLLLEGVLKRWAYVAYFSTCLPGQEEDLLAKMGDFIGESAPRFLKPELLKAEKNN